MLRAALCFENNDLTEFDSTSANGTWSIATNATSPISGTYDLKISTGASPSGTGCYGEIKLGAAGGIWFPPIGDNAVLSSTYPGFWEIGFDYMTDMGTGTNIIRILTFGGGSVGITLTTGRAFNVVGNSTVNTGKNLAASTRYRIRVRIGINTKGEGYLQGTAYTNGGHTIYAQACVTLGTWTAGTSVDRVYIGAVPFIFQNGAQAHYFDNIVISDHQDPNSTGVFASTLGGYACVGVSRPNGAGAKNDFSTTGSATHYQNVDETGAPDTSDYNTSHTGAALDKDTYDFADYGGGDTVKAMAVCINSDSGTDLTDDVFHSGGIYDGTDYLQSQMTAAGSTDIYHFVPIGEKRGGGALDSTYINAAEISINKYQNLLNLNNKDIFQAYTNIFDDDGVTSTANPLSNQRKKAHVT